MLLLIPDRPFPERALHLEGWEVSPRSRAAAGAGLSV